MFRIQKKSQKQLENKHNKKDPYLLEQIQPNGGVTFKHEDYILTGTGYQTCIHVYAYPKSLPNHWIATLMNIPNTICVADFETLDTQDVKRNLSRSMEEQDMRYQMTENFSEKMEAEQRFKELQYLLKELSSMKEIVKEVQFRIYVAAHTKEELDKQVRDIITPLDIDGYKSAIMLNEMEAEWNALWLPYEEQKKEQFAMKGQPLGSQTIAAGNPYHFSYLEDTYGMPYGITACGGNFIFDLFHADKKRTHYNAIVNGLMGVGKSTLLKMIMEDRASRGDYVRAFDVSGEFTDLTYGLGGKVLNLDGREGIVNPLEIFKADEEEQNNYPIHISKLITQYKFFKPQADVEELNTYQETLDELYEYFGIKAITGNKENQITGLPVEKYPIYQDLLDFLEEKVKRMMSKEYDDIEKELVVEELMRLNRVKKTISTMISTYGHVLNGHTSIRISDEQIVTFNVSSLKKMSNSIFQAVTFNILFLCWNDSVINGTIMKDTYEKGKIAFDEITRYLMIIDEAPQLLNTENLQAFELIRRFLREGRKYFIGIIFAAQSIKDFFPNMDEKRAAKIAEIFEMAKYKFVFQQDESVCGILRDIFGKSLTESQIQQIPTMQRGECYVAISGVRTYQVQIEVSEEELQLFAGGV
ncbi:VirB4 family type IV secretion system protein [Blautia sp.]|uniref:VirB4 family type IV secretion system protein n=1 Tax=Blautia sp. TaxID=1955243 RepID=UPI0025882839|nr:hypothetical protein [Blautia sp.]